MQSGLLTVAVALARPLSVVVLPHTVKLCRVGHSVGVHADFMNRHLNVRSLGENDAVVSSREIVILLRTES